MEDPQLTINDPVLRDVVERLTAVFQPDRIYLFGSRARENPGADSDYDLLVIVPDDASSERKQSHLAYRALRGTRVAADVLVWTRGDFDSRLHLPASLPATVTREGRILYAA